MLDIIINSADIEYNDERHEYKIQGDLWRNVTGIIGAVFGNNYERVSGEKLEDARYRGQYVHKACELYDQDSLDLSTIDPLFLPYINSWIDFRRRTGFIPLENERRVAHRGLRYAGTLDKRGILFGRMALLDLKVVAQVYKREARVQTAAYALASGDVTVDRYVVQLRKNKMAKLIAFKNPRDFLAWKDVVSLDNWQRAA